MDADETMVGPLRPSAAAVTAAWAARVRAAKEQAERLREVAEPADFYGPMARRFAQDPRRTGDACLTRLQELAERDETWLDIGAGGGRFSLPLALRVRHVHAVDPSPSMLAVLREGMAAHGIANISLYEREWPMDQPPTVDVALMAHVGYDIEAFGTFLDAAEASAGRCVVVMRAAVNARASHVLWPQVHGEARQPYPMLQELLVLLVARGVVPEVTLVDRGSWGYVSRQQLVDSARRLLGLEPGSAKDRVLETLVAEQATERDGQWELDWTPMPDGIVTWTTERP